MSTTKINLPRGDSLDIPFTVKIDGAVPADVASGTVTFALNAVGSDTIIIQKSATPSAAPDGIALIVLLEADTKLLANNGSYEYEFRYVNGNVRKAWRGKWDSVKSLLAPTV